jgi:hypothetical protein
MRTWIRRRWRSRWRGRARRQHSRGADAGAIAKERSVLEPRAASSSIEELRGARTGPLRSAGASRQAACGAGPLGIGRRLRAPTPLEAGPGGVARHNSQRVCPLRSQTLCSSKCRVSMKRTRGPTLRSRAVLRRPDRLPGDALHAGLHRTPPAATMNSVAPAGKTHEPPAVSAAPPATGMRRVVVSIANPTAPAQRRKVGFACGSPPPYAFGRKVRNQPW